LVTGGSDGIGFGIAEAFAQAGAAYVIITGRSQDKLDKATARLTEGNPNTKIEGISSDSGDENAIKALWQKLASNKVFVDVLITNASAPSTISNLEDEIYLFHVNIIGTLRQLEQFRNQPNPEGRQQFFIQISSGALQMYP
jgi:short-subunit dehydrogenase